MHSKFAAVLAVALSLGFAQPVFAADMPVKAVAAPGYNWAGFYLGIEGGGGWGRSSQTVITSTATSGPYNQRGGLIGGTIGWNYQLAPNWILGLEGDMAWANINGAPFLPGICAGAVCFTNLRTFGTFRPRLGYAWDRWMIYATAGLAWGNIDAGQDSCTPSLCGTKDMFGWTAGGGVEAFIMPKWSVKVEFLYADLGKTVVYNPGTPIVAPEKVSIARAGLNYHF